MQKTPVLLDTKQGFFYGLYGGEILRRFYSADLSICLTLIGMYLKKVYVSARPKRNRISETIIAAARTVPNL